MHYNILHKYEKIKYENGNDTTEHIVGVKMDEAKKRREYVIEILKSQIERTNDVYEKGIMCLTLGLYLKCHDFGQSLKKEIEAENESRKNIYTSRMER